MVLRPLNYHSELAGRWEIDSEQRCLCNVFPGQVRWHKPSIEMVMQQDAELERNLGYMGGLSGMNK